MESKTPKKCKHDFSYEGKKRCDEIKCKHCGGVVEWVNKEVAKLKAKGITV